jgi:hypothetical protein
MNIASTSIRAHSPRVRTAVSPWPTDHMTGRTRSSTEAIGRLAVLHDKGVLSKAELQQVKAECAGLIGAAVHPVSAPL